MVYGHKTKRNQTLDDNRDRDRNYDNNNYDQPEFDQFGNRINRYKRQNFGNPGPQDRPQYGQYDNRNNPNNEQYGQDNRERPYNRDQDGRYGQYDDNNRNQYDPQNENPFNKDPYSLNRGEFGENIDPYQDGSYVRNRDKIFNNTLPTDTDYDQRDFTLYESFSLFESPRLHANLLFQVCFF